MPQDDFGFRPLTPNSNGDDFGFRPLTPSVPQQQTGEPSEGFMNKFFTGANAARTGLALGGSAVGALPPVVAATGGLSIPAGRFLGGALGEVAGRYMEGQPFNPYVTGVEGLLNMINIFKAPIPGKGAALKEFGKYIGQEAVEGGVQAGLGVVPRSVAASGKPYGEWTMPSLGEAVGQVGTGTAFGGAFGGLVGGGNIARGHLMSPSPAPPPPPNGIPQPSGPVRPPYVPPRPPVQPPAAMPTQGEFDLGQPPPIEPYQPLLPGVLNEPVPPQPRPNMEWADEWINDRESSRQYPLPGLGNEFDNSGQGNLFPQGGLSQIPVGDFSPRAGNMGARVPPSLDPALVDFVMPSRPRTEPVIQPEQPPVEQPTIQPNQPINTKGGQGKVPAHMPVFATPEGDSVVYDTPNVETTRILEAEGFQRTNKQENGSPVWTRPRGVQPRPVVETPPTTTEGNRTYFDEDKGFPVNPAKLTQAVLDDYKSKGYHPTSTDDEGNYIFHRIDGPYEEMPVTPAPDKLPTDTPPTPAGPVTEGSQGTFPRGRSFTIPTSEYTKEKGAFYKREGYALTQVTDDSMVWTLTRDLRGVPPFTPVRRKGTTPTTTTTTTPDPNKPKTTREVIAHHYDAIKKIEDRNLPDTAYRYLTGGGNQPLKPGETWRGRVQKFIENLESVEYAAERKNLTSTNAQYYQKIVDGLDNKNSHDNAYRDLMKGNPTYNIPLREGETWRGRMLRSIKYMEDTHKLGSVSEMRKEHPIHATLRKGLKQAKDFFKDTKFILQDGTPLTHDSDTHSEAIRKLGLQFNETLRSGVVRVADNFAGVEANAPITYEQARTIADGLVFKHRTIPVDIFSDDIDEVGNTKYHNIWLEPGMEAGRIKAKINNYFSPQARAKLNISEMKRGGKDLITHVKDNLNDAEDAESTRFVLPDGTRKTHNGRTHEEGLRKIGINLYNALSDGIMRVAERFYGAEVHTPITSAQADHLADMLIYRRKSLFVDILSDYTGANGKRYYDHFEIPEGSSSDTIRNMINSKFTSEAVDKMLASQMATNPKKNPVAVYQSLQPTETGHVTNNRGDKYTPEELAAFNGNPRIQQVAEVMKNMIERLRTLFPEAPITTKKYGFDLADVGAGGLNVRDGNESAILINLFDSLAEGRGNPKEAADAFAHAILHEFAHNLVREEGHRYTWALRQADTRFGSQERADVAKIIRGLITDGTGQYDAGILELLQQHTAARGRPDAPNDFAYGSQEGTDIGEPGQGGIPPRRKLVGGSATPTATTGSRARAPRLKKDAKPASNLREAWNFSRGITTILDMSSALKQGLPLFYTKAYWKSMRPMWEAWKNETAYQEHLADLKTRKYMKPYINTDTNKLENGIARQAGIKLMDADKKLDTDGEVIASNWVESGNMFGKGSTLQKAYQSSVGKFARKSNRAYTAMLNELRVSSFEAFYDQALALSKSPKGLKGIDPETDEGFRKQLADFVNTATGKGPLRTYLIPTKGENGKWTIREADIEKHTRLFSEAFFAPGLMAARTRMLNPLTYLMAPPFVREQYLKTMMLTHMAWMGTATLAAGMGAEVETDPRSADFMKIKINDTRIDLGAGFQQFEVAIARLILGMSESSLTKELKETGKGYQANTRKDIAIRFLANKLQPTFKGVYDLFAASENQPVYLADRTLQGFLPLITQDAIELLTKDPALAPLLVPMFFGAGSQTYEKGEAVSKIIPKEYDYRFEGGSFLR